MAHTAYEGYNFDKSREFLVQAAAKVSNNDEKGCATFLNGAIAQKTEQFDQAIQSYNEVTALEKSLSHEKWVVPHSLVGLAEIYFSRKDNASALTTINKAKTYSNYEFSQLNGWKIKQLLEKLNAPDVDVDVDVPATSPC